MSEKIRLAVEQTFAEEIATLQKHDSGHKPTNWHLSPQSVVTYFSLGWSFDHRLFVNCCLQIFNFLSKTSLQISIFKL